ncbi:hypothetical protein [Candidatus Spongiihabitans sp.]|uniref:hypothetical protein n=1 Tax=Candidatus Spongiihabitans sp. TaxID=3101308 RepID=UPI003C6F2F40
MACAGRSSVSHEWICQYIRKDQDYGGDWHPHLRCREKRRKRLAAVGQSSRLGDWELDTVYGKNNTAVMLSMADRASRFVCIDILPNGTARAAGRSLVGILPPSNIGFSR